MKNEPFSPNRVWYASDGHVPYRVWQAGTILEDRPLFIQKQMDQCIFNMDGLIPYWYASGL